MNGRLLLYALLALVWAGLAIAITFGIHEQVFGLGRGDDWKRYLAVGLCGLMFLMNLARIYLIRQRQRARSESHDFPR